MLNSKNIICLIAAMSIITSSTIASYAVTPSEAISEEYLINHGHSVETVRLVRLQNNQTKGIKTVKEEKVLTWPVRMFKKLHLYLDPSINDESFGQTNIRQDSYSVKDKLPDNL